MEVRMYMNNNWSVFKEDGFASRRRKPRVMLNAGRAFRLNKKAMELIGNPKAVQFLFDVGQSRIGIQAVDPDAAHSFLVAKETLGQCSSIRGAMFCNFYGIKPESTIEFQSVRVDEEGTLILDLKTARRSTR